MKRLALIATVGVITGAAATLARARRARVATRARAVDGDRLARTATLTRLGSRAGADLAATKVRGAFATPERREQLREEFEMRTVEDVVSALGNMKGAVMKLGQMASYLDQGMPEHLRAALAQLQSDAPSMAPELAAKVIEEELGSPPEHVFASWDPTPIAAASIGQVHRAVTHDGLEVAVKVQYPGVDEAIRADLENSDLLFGAMGMMFPGLDPKPIVSELRERLVEELDYRNEAANQQRFAESFAGHPTISIPPVRHDLSGARVLTTQLAHGVPFSAVARWPQEERDLAGETIFRYAFGGIYRLGIFNGDPHPGNYLFEPGGRVTFLDYGLCKVFQPAEVELFQHLVTAMCFDRDPDAFIRLSEEIGFLTGADRLSPEVVHDYFSHFYDLVIEDQVKTVTPEFASESVRRYFDLTGPYAEIIRSANLPPSMVIIQRINLGLFAVLADLGATANWRRIAEEIWPWVQGPPSTPMGEAIAEWEAARG